MNEMLGMTARQVGSSCGDYNHTVSQQTDTLQHILDDDWFKYVQLDMLSAKQSHQEL